MATRSASQTAKKLTIKVKSKPEIPLNFLDTTWRALESALKAVRERRPAAHGHQELYNMVENLCLHRFGSETYVKLYKDVDAHLSSAIRRIWETGGHHEARPFLEYTSRFWFEYVEEMKAIRLIFTVLDRSPKCMTQTEVPSARSLWDMGIQLFRHHLVASPECLQKLVASVLAVIRDERKFGFDASPFTAHHDVLRMLSSLDLYAAHFEPSFLSETIAFYTNEASDNARTLTVPDYLAACESRWAEESRRSMTYLDASTRKPLRQAVERTLLVERATSLTDRGLDQLLDDEARLFDLARMYKLYCAVNMQALLIKGFGTYVRAKGMSLVMDDENTDLVGSLLSLKGKVDQMIKVAFQSDEAVNKANRDAFEAFVNARDNKPAELIAKYADKALRSSAVADSLSVLERTMELFRFLHAKDVFEEFYKQALAKRLLLGTSSSNDLERTMITRLKSECGSSFTNKLEGMFRDMELGKALLAEWQLKSASSQQQQVKSLDGGGLSTSVQVLSMGFWPTFPDSPVRLPPSLAEEQERFKGFYTAKHQGRVLHFVNSLAHCVVRVQLPKGKWDLEVSLFQALVLLQFNSAPSVSFTQLVEATGVNKEELARTVVSLALGRKDQRVLLRTEKGSTPVLGGSGDGDKSDNEDEDEEEGRKSAPPPPGGGAAAASSAAKASRLPHAEDVYAVNREWSSKKLRLKINQVQIKETKKENEDSHKRVAHDRQYQVDAAIVRIMKARKKLSHTLLVTELFKQLSFPAKPQDLKKRIESLIERDYLERDEEDPNTYVYQA